MTGKAKIEQLTNSWYGFAVFSALSSLLLNGIGFFSIAAAIFGLLVSWTITFLIGRALLKKSSLVRTLLVIFSALATVAGVLGIARMGWSFVRTWDLVLLGSMGYSAISTWMNAKSFRVLTDRSVKAYFG